MRYIFFGTSEFARIILQELLQSDMRPILVVTQPPKPKGRKQILFPSPVQILAEQNHLPFLTPPKLDDENFLQTVKNLQPDFALLTAYGKIIPQTLLSLPPKGFLNLHPSLLPKWRGATPIQSTILAGDKKTGVTLFLMDEQIDHGPMIANSKFKIQNSKLTYGELSKELAILGAKLIIETLPQWLEGKITPLPQDESLATYCHKITPEDEKINWRTSAEEVDRKVRALNPNPGVYTMTQKKVIKIIKGFPTVDNKLSTIKQIGEDFEYEKKMAIKCGKGVYVVETLKPAGKITMTSENFLRGNRWILEQVLR